ncbi:MAG: amidase domain-containing protein, partial [Clostridia bacterium]
NADVNDIATVTANFSATKNVVISAVTDWVNANYKEFYDIKDVHADIVRTHTTETATNYTVAITCMTKLKAPSVKSLPFIQGMYAKLSSSKIISGTAKEAVDQYVNEVDFTNEYTSLSLDIVVAVSNSSKSAGLTMYFQDGMNTTLYPVEVLKLDSKQMYQDGKSSVDAVVAKYQSAKNTVSLMGYSPYNRVAARDYALAWTGSNVSVCYDDGTSCGMLQNRSLWNNSAYPYISTLKHSDCADFVSQCMAAGGIPAESAKWDRFNDGGNGWSWTYVPGLKTYMTGKGYWDASTFAAANAGNILLWSDESHVALITLNDTVTHRFTAHTNDRENYQFYSSVAYNYYTMKTT